MDTLSHIWKLRQGFKKDGVSKKERKYIDFIISHHPLSDILNAGDMDRITLLGWGLEDKAIIDEFLTVATPELKSGRIIIYGCPECADIGCGAITAEIINSNNKIIWKNFGCEDGHEDIDFGDYRHIGPFEFDKQEYTLEFAKINKEIQSIPRPEEYK